MNKKYRSFSKRRLEQHVLIVCSLAKDICPEAEIEIHIPGFGGLDAWLDVVVDDERVLEMDETMSQRAFEIYMEEGYDIGMNVIEWSVANEGKISKMNGSEVSSRR